MDIDDGDGGLVTSGADLIEMAFSKKQADNRKTWLSKVDKNTFLNYSVAQKKGVNYSDFINKELVLFSQYDTCRSLPHMIDGLKVSQRKVLYACLSFYDDYARRPQHRRQEQQQQQQQQRLRCRRRRPVVVARSLRRRALSVASAASSTLLLLLSSSMATTTSLVRARAEDVTTSSSLYSSLFSPASSGRLSRQFSSQSSSSPAVVVFTSAGTANGNCDDLSYITGPMHESDTDGDGVLNQEEYVLTKDGDHACLHEAAFFHAFLGAKLIQPNESPCVVGRPTLLYLTGSVAMSLGSDDDSEGVSAQAQQISEICMLLIS